MQCWDTVSYCILFFFHFLCVYVTSPIFSFIWWFKPSRTAPSIILILAGEGRVHAKFEEKEKVGYHGLDLFSGGEGWIYGKDFDLCIAQFVKRSVVIIVPHFLAECVNVDKEVGQSNWLWGQRQQLFKLTHPCNSLLTSATGRDPLKRQKYVDRGSIPNQLCRFPLDLASSFCQRGGMGGAANREKEREGAPTRSWPPLPRTSSNLLSWWASSSHREEQAHPPHLSLLLSILS